MSADDGPVRWLESLLGVSALTNPVALTTKKLGVEKPIDRSSRSVIPEHILEERFETPIYQGNAVSGAAAGDIDQGQRHRCHTAAHSTATLARRPRSERPAWRVLVCIRLPKAVLIRSPHFALNGARRRSGRQRNHTSADCHEAEGRERARYRVEVMGFEPTASTLRT
jgi:hypothetical protein